MPFDRLKAFGRDTGYTLGPDETPDNHLHRNTQDNHSRQARLQGGDLDDLQEIDILLGVMDQPVTISVPPGSIPHEDEAKRVTVPDPEGGTITLDKLILRAAAAAGVSPRLLGAACYVESAYNPAARNGANHGLMQVIPGTFASIWPQAVRRGITHVKGDYPPDPWSGLVVGAVYLKMCLDEAHGNEYLGVGVYNAGIYAVRQAGMKIPERITRYPLARPQGHVRKVMVRELGLPDIPPALLGGTVSGR